MRVKRFIVKKSIVKYDKKKFFIWNPKTVSIAGLGILKIWRSIIILEQFKFYKINKNFINNGYLFFNILGKKYKRFESIQYSWQADQNITKFHWEILSNMLDSGAEIYLGKGKIVKYGLNIFIYIFANISFLYIEIFSVKWQYTIYYSRMYMGNKSNIQYSNILILKIFWYMIVRRNLLRFICF